MLYKSKNLLKLTVIIFLICCSRITFSQNLWINQASPTNQNLVRLSYADSINVWAVGDSGTIIHTSNGGNTWEIQNSKILNNIKDVFFLNDSLGWALAINNDSVPYGTIVLKSTDGGNFWTHELYRGEDIFFNKIYFLDSLNGFMAGFSGAFVKTVNGGNRWDQVKLDSNVVANLPVLNLSFYNSQRGFACGGILDISGVIWKTTDYGISWISQGVSADPINELHIIDSLNIIGVGGDYEFGTGVIKSTDGGESWNYQSLQTFGIAYAIAFRTSYEIWAPLGFAQKFVYSIDSGLTWTSYETPGASVYDLVFTDSTHGYGVGDHGTILKYVPQQPDGIQDFEKNFHKTFILDQNFPNPFNPNTNIQFSIGSRNFVSLKVYDILGREVSILVQKEMEPGKYKVTFDGSNLPSGIYFYKLTAGKFRNIKKMILMK